MTSMAHVLRKGHAADFKAKTFLALGGWWCLEGRSASRLTGVCCPDGHRVAMLGDTSSLHIVNGRSVPQASHDGPQKIPMLSIGHEPSRRGCSIGSRLR